MEYIIQENTFKEEHYEMLYHTLDRYGLKNTRVRVYPFIDKVADLKEIPEEFINVEDIPDFEPINKEQLFVFGSIKLGNIARKKGWRIGSLINDNHNYEVYSKYYKDNLLNYDSEIIKVGDYDSFNWKEEEYFIRPTEDTKAFTGAVFKKKEFEEMLERVQNYTNATIRNPETKIQISAPKNIMKEIRFFVVGGKVITGSQYRLGNTLLLDEKIDQEAIDFAQQMVDIYQLARGFVIDVCLTKNGWKIVECGCINHAGFYKSNINKLIETIENEFNYE